MNIYRDPSFKFFVDYLKEHVIIDKRIIAIIKILNIKPTERLVMLPLVQGFVYALHHAWEEFATWNMDIHTLIGNTYAIAVDVREKNIKY
jgi:hypothetical protein